MRHSKEKRNSELQQQLHNVMLKLFVEGGVRAHNDQSGLEPESPTDMNKFLYPSQQDRSQQIFLPIGFALVKAPNDKLHIIET